MVYMKIMKFIYLHKDKKYHYRIIDNRVPILIFNIKKNNFRNLNFNKRKAEGFRVSKSFFEKFYIKGTVGNHKSRKSCRRVKVGKSLASFSYFDPLSENGFVFPAP